MKAQGWGKKGRAEKELVWIEKQVSMPATPRPLIQKCHSTRYMIISAMISKVSLFSWFLRCGYRSYTEKLRRQTCEQKSGLTVSTG